MPPPSNVESRTEFSLAGTRWGPQADLSSPAGTIDCFGLSTIGMISVVLTDYRYCNSPAPIVAQVIRRRIDRCIRLAGEVVLEQVIVIANIRPSGAVIWSVKVRDSVVKNWRPVSPHWIRVHWSTRNTEAGAIGTTVAIVGPTAHVACGARWILKVVLETWTQPASAMSSSHCP